MLRREHVTSLLLVTLLRHVSQYSTAKTLEHESGQLT